MPDAIRDYHAAHDVFAGFGEHGQPAVVGDPITIEAEEDGRSSHAAATADGALVIAVVTTDDPSSDCLCERAFVHLTRQQVLQLLDMLPAPGDGTMDD